MRGSSGLAQIGTLSWMQSSQSAFGAIDGKNSLN